MRISALVLAGCVLLAAGCGGGGSDGAGSPEEAFQIAQDAGKNKDHRKMFLVMDPEERDLGLVGMMLVAGFSMIGKDEEAAKKMKEEMESIMKRHGVEKQEGATVNLDDKAKAKEAAKKVFAKVADKPGLYSELAEFVDKHGKNEAGDSFEDGTLKDVKIEGDKATGQFERKKGGGSTIHFVRRNGKWYLADN